MTDLVLVNHNLVQLNAEKTEITWIGTRQQLDDIRTDADRSSHQDVAKYHVSRRRTRRGADICATCEASCCAMLLLDASAADNQRSALRRQRQNACPCHHIHPPWLLQHVAGVHLCPFQSVLNASARLVVRKRKLDIITTTLRDDRPSTGPTVWNALRLAVSDHAWCKQDWELREATVKSSSGLFIASDCSLPRWGLRDNNHNAHWTRHGPRFKSQDWLNNLCQD